MGAEVNLSARAAPLWGKARWGTLWGSASPLPWGPGQPAAPCGCATRDAERRVPSSFHPLGGPVRSVLLCPHGRCAEVLIICVKRDFVWKKGLYRGNQVIMGSRGWPESSTTGVLINRASEDPDRDAGRERPGDWRVASKAPEPRGSAAREAGRTSPLAPVERSVARRTPCFQLDPRTAGS